MSDPQAPDLNLSMRVDPDPRSQEGSPDISAWRTVYLIGIGGAGMRAIATLLLARGIQVAGSDLKDSSGLQALAAAGATVFVGHRADQVTHAEAVVVSSAVPSTNVEVERARELGLAVLSRAQVLAALMRGHCSIAVAGTHGKTTTTSMVAVMLERLGLDPTYVIGGDLNESGSGARHGSGDAFVAEADESDGSFLLYRPTVGVITNVDEDHLDYYRDRADVEGAFRAFGERAGTVVACWDDAGARAALAGADLRLVRYGSSGNGAEELDVVVLEPDLASDGARATMRVRGTDVPISLSVRGRHNLLNAAAALAVASVLRLPIRDAADALGSFTGVRRRFEARGEAGGATFVDDYAHHPAEVAATMEVARAAGHRRVIAVFQPHRYSRTRALGRALGESLASADIAVVTDVYGAGERPMPGITGKLLVDALAERAPGTRIVYLPRRSEVARFLAKEVRAGDLVLTRGAGDMPMVGDETLARIREGGA